MPPRQGPLLYADIRMGRGAPGSGPDLPADLKRQSLALIKRHGGVDLDPTATRLMAGFLRHQDALNCAHDIRTLINRHPADAMGATSSGRILLAHGDIPEPESARVPQLAMTLAIHMARLPPDSVAGVQEFVDQLSVRPPTVSFGISAVGSHPTMIHLFASAGFAITQEERTSEMAALSIPVGRVYSELTLRVGDRTEIFHPTDCPITLGRGRTFGVVVRAPEASRIHARIDYISEKFVFQDVSRNGSSLVFPGGNELRLQKESMPLMGDGVISLGSPVAHKRGELVFFGCSTIAVES